MRKGAGVMGGQVHLVQAWQAAGHLMVECWAAVAGAHCCLLLPHQPCLASRRLASPACSAHHHHLTVLPTSLSSCAPAGTTACGQSRMLSWAASCWRLPSRLGGWSWCSTCSSTALPRWCRHPGEAADLALLHWAGVTCPTLPWHGTAWHGVAWHGMASPGLAVPSEGAANATVSKSAGEGLALA